ncbi:hypothetical protein [Dactylosporangium sp. NPDC048998]|uniref:hypothetical protein n=1 Tax=Dactylosporangium sp. NPDC048998 TaxID=3363976 RepID=UPI00371F6FFF
MGDAYVYRSPADLQVLGERVRDTAIRVTLTHAEQYLMAQQRANNKASQGQPEYISSSRADDDARLRTFVAEEFAGIPTMFSQFAVPDPNACQPMADALFRVAATLQPSLQLKAESNRLYDPVAVGNDTLKFPLGAYTDAIQVRMQHWAGSAADSFMFYLKLYERSTLCQRQVAVGLALTLQAELEIKRRMLTDVWTLGETTIKVLDALDHFHCPTRGGAAMILTVIGALAAVAVAAGPVAESLLAAGTGAAIAGIQGVLDPPFTDERLKTGTATDLDNTGGQLFYDR